jgi:hypothetical protein
MVLLVLARPHPPTHPPTHPYPPKPTHPHTGEDGSLATILDIERFHRLLGAPWPHHPFVVCAFVLLAPLCIDARRTPRLNVLN